MVKTIVQSESTKKAHSSTFADIPNLLIIHQTPKKYKKTVKQLNMNKFKYSLIKVNIIISKEMGKITK